VSLSAAFTAENADVFGSGFAGLPPSLPLLAEVFALSFEVLLPRNAASLLSSFTRQTYITNAKFYREISK
jgi:hypothetical protein